MTDSDSDASNSVFTFQNVNTTVSAKGPNTNITNMRFRNQLTSTMCMPRNFERQRYAESVCDQRSMYYRRETSPMSIHSACDIRPRNFQQYYGGMSSQQSVFNGRSGSPMSVRSIDSSASVSAADIAFAFKNVKFNKYDLKVIKDAYHRLMKQRVRKRIEKRRNMRLFLKGNRRRSGYDSGEQGSNSSISSDECRSVKTSYKENMSTTRSTGFLTDFRKTDRDNIMLQDSATNFRQNTFKNKFSVGSSSNINTQNYNNSAISKQSNLIPTQKERFKNGFLLPSQRFNRSVASSVIPESSEKPQRSAEDNVRNHYAQNKQNKNNLTSSEDEQIFSETVREISTFNTGPQGKRSLDSEDEASLPEKKKSKLSSPTKTAQRNKKVVSKPKIVNAHANTSNFEFAVPSLPVRKSRPKVQEQLIAKSGLPLTEFLEPVISAEVLKPCNVEEKSSNNQNQLELPETTQNSEVSMRPSFIKRKLFTQKLDVAEKANLSDGTSSPHSNVYTLQKEKNKARKLVTSQSCLNRDVQDDNNLLDLIHKIVPAERMNITNQTTINQTKTDVNNKNKKDNEDKWDVTSVISMCNEDDVSDTYTDEEIFEKDVTKITKSNKNKEQEKNCNVNLKPSEPNVPNNNQKPRDCRIVLEKLENNNTVQKLVNNNNFNLTHNNITKSNVKSSVKSFWDTDFESDAECHTAPPRSYVLDNLKKANATLEVTKQDLKKSSGYEKNQVSKKSLPIPECSKQLNNTTMNNTVMNNTLDSTRKFNASTLSIRTHRITTKKKCFNETCVDDTMINPDSKKKVAQKKSEKSNEPKRIPVEKHNSKEDQNKKISENLKAKQNKQNETKERSASNTRKNNHNDVKLKPDKQNESPKKRGRPKSKTKSNDKANESVTKTLKSKPGKENKQSAAKNKEDTQTTKHTPKSQPEQTKKKETKIKTPTKSRAKKDIKNNSIVSNSSQYAVSKAKSKLNTMEPNKQLNISISGRPMRSCRASSQNRSQDVSSLSLNTSEQKSLRSRIINLSSSIENITIKIKPSKKVNQSMSQMKTRMSDVSFSLSNKMTPKPKNNIPRNRADFFKGKRKA